MRLALVLSTVLLATIVALSAACGGSSSETPWPVEPDPSMIAPPPDLLPLTSDDDAGTRRRK
jgi:hypothetical protein